MMLKYGIMWEKNNVINHPPVITIFIKVVCLPFPVMGGKNGIVLPIWGFIQPIVDFHWISPSNAYGCIYIYPHRHVYTWWLIPLSKWVITPVISG